MYRLIVCLLIVVTSCHKKSEEVKTPRFQVEVVKPTVRDVELFKTYVGNVQPYVQVEVQAQVEGELTGYYFTEGEMIKAGDLLFTIDSRPFKAQLLKAEAALAQSLAGLRYAKDVAKRNAPLAVDDYVSQQQYDEYVTQVMSYQAQVKENEADIETAKINISYCNIHSPIDAVTGKLQIQVGNLIKNAESTPLITLNQITPIYAYFSVPQKDLPKIMELHRKEPLRVSAFLEGDESRPYAGALDLIDNQVNDQTGSIWLRGVFPNETQMLWPGEFVSVHLYTEARDGAILVPTEALSLGQKGSYLFVIKSDNTSEIRYVQVGQRIGDMTLIEKGIDPSEQVVVKGQLNLGNGTPVQIRRSK